MQLGSVRRLAFALTACVAACGPTPGAQTLEAGTGSTTTGDGESGAPATGRHVGSSTSAMHESGGADETGSSPACGNGVLDPGEDCDDGNRFDHDGCRWHCMSDDGHRIATGLATSCAAWPGGLRCWGHGAAGSVGPGAVTPECYNGERFSCLPALGCCVGDDELPSDFPQASTAEDISAVAVSWRHACVVRSGSLECWGATFMPGVPPDPRCAARPLLDCAHPGCCLGDDEPVPENPQPLGPVAQVAAGESHICALTEGGEVFCWGLSRVGNLGTLVPDGEVIGDDEPIDARGPLSLGGEVAFIKASRDATCAVLVGGDVRCWGACLGESTCFDGTPSDPIGDDEVPSDLPPLALPAPVIDIDIGTRHACAVLDGGAVHCWGHDGVEDAMGYPGVDQVAVTDSGAVAVPAAVKVATGSAHSCALTEDGALHCWGHPWATGYATSIGPEMGLPPAETPAVSLGGLVADVDASGSHTCALRFDGEVLCWGSDQGRGQLGYGSDNFVGDDETPIDVGPVSYK